MQKNKLGKIISLLSLSLAVYGNSNFSSSAPFNAHDEDTFQKYLLNNIATEKHTFIKKDDGRILHSRPGAVLASPSYKGKDFSQDYQFHWVRDAAITMNEVAYYYEKADLNIKKRLKPYLINYINFEHVAQQQISNPGEQTLGQPKYNIDGSIWEGKWMRPQNDGPALRAITIMHIMRILNNDHSADDVTNKTALAVITTDLNYIAANWQEDSYGPWEEVKDQHFFNKLVQRKALLEGADFVKQYHKNQKASLYKQQAQKISLALSKHYNPSLGYYNETLTQSFFKGGGLDSSILLGALYGDIDKANDPFAPSSDQMLSSVYFIRNAFAALYKLNIYNPEAGVLIGRYPNDIYDGYNFLYGNPWVLITNALAQYYYTLVKIYLEQGFIIINKNNCLFFQQIDNNFIYHRDEIITRNNSQKFKQIINTLIRAGDKELLAVKAYGVCYSNHSCNHYAEQIDRASAKQVSAKDLTWGYATFLSAMRVRDEVVNLLKHEHT